MENGMRARFALAGATLSALALMTFPALASAATISGSVREAAGAQAPLEGVRVCANQQNYKLESWCTTTDAAGNYSLAVEAGLYSVFFDDTARNRNVVSQYYGNPQFPGTLVDLPAEGDSRTGIDAQLQPGSTITGTVTDAVTHAGIAGIPVCAERVPFQAPVGRCQSSGPGGTYVINGLAAGTYNVTFESGELNYQPQRYLERDPLGPGTPVEIFAPGETRAAIDGALEVGVEISGRLTEAGTGAPVVRTEVEALWAGGLRSASRYTDGDGRYVFRGLPEADYVLLFSGPEGTLGPDPDCFERQYYAGASSPAGATILHGVPGVPLTGLDAQLANYCPKPPPPAPPLQVTFSPSSAPVGSQRQRSLRCRKGFHRKRIKGVVRCVKTRRPHHRHRNRHRHHPPGAVASRGAGAYIYSPAP